MQVFDVLGSHRLLVEVALVGGGSIHSGCPQGHLSLLLKEGGKGMNKDREICSSASLVNCVCPSSASPFCH